MNTKHRRRPRQVASSAVVVMLVIRFALGEQPTNAPSRAAAEQATSPVPARVTWEWRLTRVIFP